LSFLINLRNLYYHVLSPSLQKYAWRLFGVFSTLLPYERKAKSREKKSKKDCVCPEKKKQKRLCVRARSVKKLVLVLKFLRNWLKKLVLA